MSVTLKFNSSEWSRILDTVARVVSDRVANPVSTASTASRSNVVNAKRVAKRVRVAKKNRPRRSIGLVTIGEETFFPRNSREAVKMVADWLVARYGTAPLVNSSLNRKGNPTTDGYPLGEDDEVVLELHRCSRELRGQIEQMADLYNLPVLIRWKDEM